MASVAQRYTTANAVSGGEHLVPVIADSGTQAWVVLVPFATDPRVGDTFSFRGLQWSIVHRQGNVRGFVARPRPTPVGDN